MATATSAELADALSDVLGCTECLEIRTMPIDEALGYSFTLLIEREIDPEDFLKKKGILE